MEHSCPFLSDNLMEVSGAAVELALDAKGLFVFLSEVPRVEQVLGLREDQGNQLHVEITSPARLCGTVR